MPPVVAVDARPKKLATGSRRTKYRPVIRLGPLPEAAQDERQEQQPPCRPVWDHGGSSRQMNPPLEQALLQAADENMRIPPSDEPILMLGTPSLPTVTAIATFCKGPAALQPASPLYRGAMGAVQAQLQAYTPSHGSNPFASHTALACLANSGHDAVRVWHTPRPTDSQVFHLVCSLHQLRVSGHTPCLGGKCMLGLHVYVLVGL